MSRNTTRIQSFTRVTTLSDKDVLIFGPASGDRAKGITKEDLEKQFESDNPSGISSMQIVEVTATYLALTSDDIILAKGTFNVSLPPASSGVKSLSIKSIIGGGTITVVADGSDLIEGLPTHTLTVGISITIAPTTTGDWAII